jgi:hypothetical protein
MMGHAGIRRNSNADDPIILGEPVTKPTMSTRPPYLRVVYTAPAARPDATPWPPHWSGGATGSSLHLVGSERAHVDPEPEPVAPPMLYLVGRETPPAPATSRKSRLGVALVTMGSLITFGMAVAAAPLTAVPASAVIAAIVGLTLWG